MHFKALLLLCWVILSCSCSGKIQLGREFDEQGQEIDQHEINKSTSKKGIRTADKTVQPEWRGDENYWGEEDKPVVTFNGQLGDITLDIVTDPIPPYISTRDIRMANRVAKVGFLTAAAKAAQEDADSSKTRVNQQFSNISIDTASRLLEQHFSTQLQQEQRSNSPQTLNLKFTQWGVSDDWGLYSESLRVLLTAEAILLNADGTEIWQSTVTIDQTDTDRPAATIEELEENPQLLMQHLDIAAQFLAHRIITALTDKRFTMPKSYQRDRWVDIDDD